MKVLLGALGSGFAGSSVVANGIMKGSGIVAVIALGMLGMTG